MGGVVCVGRGKAAEDGIEHRQPGADHDQLLNLLQTKLDASCIDFSDIGASGDSPLYTGDTAPASTAPAKYKVGSSDFILSNGESGNVNPYKNLSCKWDDNRDYLYPIPTDERNLTNGALTQNPGWNDGLTF